MKRKAFSVLIFVYCLYASAYILRTSFVLGGTRYFSLFDDGMVSMQYAKNLIRGHGLVWNVGGNKVEGFTNGIWVLYLAVLHLAPVPESKVSLLVQLSVALLLIGNLVFINRLAERLSNHSVFAATLAVVLTAFYLPLNFWSLEGMEVSLLTLLISIALWLGISGKEGRARLSMYLVLGAATLVRIDMTFLFLGLLGFFWIYGSDRKRHALFGCSVLTICLGAQTLFRWEYFGDVLPNAYYLKMTGYPILWRLARGAFMFLSVACKMLAILLPALVTGVVSKDWRKRLLLTGLLIQIAYSIYVGGDAWEEWGGTNRYMTLIMPMCFVLFACGIAGAWRGRGGKEPRGSVRRDWGAWISVGVLIISLFYSNAIRGPEAWQEWLLLSKPFHTDENAAMVDRARQVRSITREGARVAVVWAGALPYFMDRTAIDILGRNDRTIAHEPMHRPPSGASAFARMTFFYPGHLKYDYAYSIGRLEPDIVTQVWSHPEEAPLGPYHAATVNGVALMLRRNSPNILWDKIDNRAAGG